MAQIIKQGNILGRLGSGIGKGLAEQVPKEIERSRLASGLKELGKKKNLDTFEQFAELSGIPGITPQHIQSGTELLKQKARAQALSNQNATKPTKFPQSENRVNPNEGSKIPSLTKEDIFEKTQQGYIPPTIEDRDAIASSAFDNNPAYFNNDPQKAIDWADQKIAQEEKIAQAYQIKHGNLSKIQDNVVTRLKDQSQRLNTQVPAELYSRIEDEAIQASKPRSEGGKGLTEQQAMKIYGDKLNDASRDYSKIKDIGNWGVTLRPASDTLRSMKAIQKSMDELGETDNFAKKLQSENKLSPKLSYAIAQPVSNVPQLNQFISKLPRIEKTQSEDPRYETLKIAPQLAKYLQENEKASPLAIAYELEKKKYDPSAWLEYIVDNGNNLNLRQRQSEQASTPLNVVDPWNDWWLSSFTGLE